MKIVYTLYDENNNPIESEPVIACFPTHSIPLMYCKSIDKYFFGRYETVINGKRSDKYCIVNGTPVNVKGAEIIFHPDEVDYGDLCDEYFLYGDDGKNRTIAWDWENYRPVIVPHTKHGDWFVSVAAGDKKDVKEFENTYEKLENGLYAFGEHYETSAEDLCKKFPNIIFSGYYTVRTSNMSPCVYFQAVTWNAHAVIYVGKLFDLDDIRDSHEPVFDESGVIIEKIL